MSLSRIGKLPVAIPSGVTITVDSGDVVVKGPKGELSQFITPAVEVKVEDGQVTVHPKDESKAARAQHGLMSLGFSHEVHYKAPEGVNVTNERMVIVVTGIDKQKVGQVAAEIRALKKPEPYKGKGIMYVGEQILRKAGKAGKK